MTTRTLVNLGDADPLLEDLPELADLIRSLLWLREAGHPMKARVYTGSTSRPDARAVEKPAHEGATTRRYRNRFTQAKRRIYDLHLYVEGGLEESPLETSGPRATCANGACERHGRKLRFGAQYCDRCGEAAENPDG